MKRLLTLLPLLVVLSSAQADLVIEQKIESAFINGNMTMKIKGDKARLDMPSPAGPVSVLIDGTTGELTSIMHTQKLAMKMNGADLKKSVAETAPKLEKPKATGTKEKVGDFETEIFEITVPGTGLVRMWVAAGFPNAQAIKDQMGKFSKGMTQGKGGFNPADVDVPGLPVKTEMNTTGGKITTTILKVKEEAVADDDLKVPAGYQDMPVPAGLGK